MRLSAGVFSPDGKTALREEDEGAAEEPESLADRVADRLIARGAPKILAMART
jgi:porphobilinogen deaminase